MWLSRDPIYDRAYVVAELYRSGMTPEVMAREVLQIDKTLPVKIGGPGFRQIVQHGEPMSGVIDSASFADTGFGGRADMMNRQGCQWTPCAKDQNARIAGKALIHARLALKGDGKPGLVIFSTCRNLIRTLPALCYSKTRPEDVDTDAEDHAYDALHYGLSRKVYSVGRVRVL